MSKESKIQLEVSADDEDVAYLKLPGHPGGGPSIVKRSVSLREVLGSYSGPDINLDFDGNNVLIGIEVLS